MSIIEILKQGFRWWCNIYLKIIAPEVLNFDPKDKKQDQESIRNDVENLFNACFRHWRSGILISVFLIIGGFIGWRLLFVVFSNALGIWGSFFLPFYFVHTIKEVTIKDWKIKSDLAFCWGIIWIITALHAGVIFLWIPTTIISGVYLRIALISLCILANICSSVFVYIKYARGFNGSSN